MENDDRIHIKQTKTTIKKRGLVIEDQMFANNILK